MTHNPSHDPLDRLLRTLEQELLDAPDRDLLADDVSRDAGLAARGAVSRALASHQLRTRRSSGRFSIPASGRDRREAVRQLMLANPRARDLAGIKSVEALSDTEAEAILARFAELGMTPPDHT